MKKILSLMLMMSLVGALSAQNANTTVKKEKCPVADKCQRTEPCAASATRECPKAQAVAKQCLKAGEVHQCQKAGEVHQCHQAGEHQCNKAAGETHQCHKNADNASQCQKQIEECKDIKVDVKMNELKKQPEQMKNLKMNQSNASVKCTIEENK